MNQEQQKITVLDILIGRDVIEAIFKNLTWYFACAAIFKFSLIALNSGRHLLTSGLLLLFLFLFILNLIYGMRYILLPLDAAFDNKFETTRQKNSQPDQSSIMRLTRSIKYIFFTVPGWFYILVMLVYVPLTFKLVGIAAQQLVTK